MAFCKNCGAELGEGVQFCANCGTPVAAEPQPQQEVEHVEAQYVQPQQIQTAPPVQPQEPNQDAKKILIFGIISLAVSWIPFFGIGGIILGAIGMKTSNAYVAAGGVRCGMSVTGRILSRVGLIVSICMTVFWVIYFSAICCIGCVAASSYNYYYNY